jgi:3-phenylpropionate/cinnamic acid dioxygenase small subunit
VAELTPERLVQRTEVCDVLMQYARGIDRRDWDLVASLFTDDAYVAGTRNEARVDEYLKTLRVSVDSFGSTMHFMGNQICELADDGASAELETYAVAYHYGNIDPKAPSIVVGVRYADSMVRVDGRWRIKRRKVTAAFTRENETVLPVPPPAG